MQDILIDRVLNATTEEDLRGAADSFFANNKRIRDDLTLLEARFIDLWNNRAKTIGLKLQMLPYGPDKFKELINFALSNGTPMPEIADVFGVSVGTVRRWRKGTMAPRPSVREAALSKIKVLLARPCQP